MKLSNEIYLTLRLEPKERANLIKVLREYQDLVRGLTTMQEHSSEEGDTPREFAAKLFNRLKDKVV